MRGYDAYLIGCGLALPILAAVAGLQVPVAASPQIQMQRQVQPGMDVNRALKGNRLPVFVPSNTTPSSEPATNANPVRPRLPDGCEAPVSAMTRSSLAHTPARCIS